MAAYIIDAAVFPSVRAAIGFDTDAVTMPDSVISLPIYKDEAERFIMRHLTAAQYENAAYAEQVKYAAVLFLASLLLPTIRVVQSERIAGGNLTYEKVDLAALAARLEAQAQGRITDILEVEGAVVDDSIVPNFFRLGHRRFDNYLE